MATYYIDPSTATNGNGALATPYNTWSGVTLTANNTYLQKRGTTYVGASVRPASQSSAAATPLTIGAYYNADGSDDTSKPKPIIDHNGGTNGVGAVFVDTCTNVVVRDIDGRNSLASLGGGVTIRRSVGVLVQRCIGRDSEHGIVIQQDQASATSVCTDITIDNCDTYNNVGVGVCFRWGAVDTATLKRVTISNCRIYGNGMGKRFGSGGSSIPCAGIGVYPVNRADASYKDNSLNAGFRLRDIVCIGNSVYRNNGYGINLEMVDNEQWASRVALNDVWGNGISLDVDSHSLWLGNCFNTVVAENYVHDNYAYAGFSSGSGVGIFIDYNAVNPTGGTGCVVRGNVVERQYSGASSATLPSAGIMVFANQNTLVESNIVSNCRQGIIIGPTGGGGTDGTVVRNNLVVSATEFGIANSGATNTSVRNNAVTGAATGLFASTSGSTGFVETNNDLHNCTTPRANGTSSSPTATSADATDITGDPLLRDPTKPWLGLKPGSPCQSAGAFIQGARDRFGRRYLTPPNIGPWAVIGR